MIEILPIKSLTDEDSPVFGSLNVALGKLQRSNLPVAPGIVITPPNLKLKTVLEQYNFATKEVFEQSLTLVKKEIASTPIPEVLIKEVGNHKEYLLDGQIITSVKRLWLGLLNVWLEQIKQKLWKDGFYKGITEDLQPKIVIFIKKLEALGSCHFDPLQDDSVINIKGGKLHPNDLKKLHELVKEANKKMFIPHEYEWIIDNGIKLTKVSPFTPSIQSQISQISISTDIVGEKDKAHPKSAIKVFLDLSTGLVIEKQVDGIYISSEKIFDLNKPKDSFEDLVFRLVEAASTFPNKPILFKLADKSEGMGKIRGTLRLLHQQNLFTPLVEAMDFVRHKRGLTNVHLVIPFVRGVNEFLQIKRELAVKKLSRKNSLKHFLEIAVPENIVNLEEYLIAGLDGIVLNLDELISHLNGFDATQEEVMFYKNEVSGILKFIEDGLKLLHKSKIPFIVVGSLALYPEVLEFLVEKGVDGVVVEIYEAYSAHDLLYQAEKRMILRKST